MVDYIAIIGAQWSILRYLLIYYLFSHKSFCKIYHQAYYEKRFFKLDSSSS